MSKMGLITGISAFVLSVAPPVGLILGVIGTVLCAETEQEYAKVSIYLNVLGIVCAIVTLFTGKIYFTAIFDIFN